MRWWPGVLYVAGLALVGALRLRQDLGPARFVIWGGICEWTGFVLVAALAGWAVQRRPQRGSSVTRADQSLRATEPWFCRMQACLAAVSAAMIIWILVDPAFAALGHDVALFGLAGRLTTCPAALMLVGATILMAWQTRAPWRGVWQYAALGAAVLFSTSVGWARLDPAADALWYQRSKYVLISVSMMTLLTWFGLARVLPHSGDWITRARRVAPLFASLAALVLLLVIVRWLVG
jgi:hypothetical protein